jgi:cytochrome bd-type quinol oxidase subunit 2
MNKTQKAALYGLYLVAFILLIPLVDLVDTKINPILLRVIGYPLVILLILPLWFLNKKKTEVDMDERDKGIIRRALLISITLIVIIACLVFTICLFTLGLENAISFTINDISAVIFFTLVAFILVLSLMVLIQYGLGAKEKHHE